MKQCRLRQEYHVKMTKLNPNNKENWANKILSEIILDDSKNYVEDETKPRCSWNRTQHTAQPSVDLAGHWSVNKDKMLNTI